MTKELLRIFHSSPSLFSYQLFNFLQRRDQVQIHTLPDNPNTFIFQYKHYLTFYGHKGTIEVLLKNISSSLDESTRYEILFQNHHITSIQAFFGDFDYIDDSVTYSDSFNRLQSMTLEKANFVPRRHLKSGKRIPAELLDHFDPDLVEYANTGVIYGIIEDAELISVCPVPFIHKDDTYSFAILHGIYTNERFRRKGYATGSVRAALNFLFTRKIIKSVYLLVDEENPGKKMFEKIGFESNENQWLGARCFKK
jgi:GNAT superfamily N-acetyltransferase